MSSTVALTEESRRIVEAQIRSGRHQDAAAVVQAALRHYTEDAGRRAAWIEHVRGVISESEAAIARGDFVSIRDDADLDALFAKMIGRSPPGSAT